MLYANAVKALYKTEKMQKIALFSLTDGIKSQKWQHRSAKATKIR